MDWSNESYVRLYSRDTKTWILMGWQAHGLIGPMMRKLDRSGILEDVRDAEDLAAMLADGTPVEIVAAGLAAMVKHNVVVVTEKGLLMPNFIEAQSASKSDKLRQKESRDNRRLESQKVVEPSRNVTKPSRKVARKSQPVTSRHEPSQHVTLCSAVLSSALPDSAVPGPEDLPRSPDGEPTAGLDHKSLIVHYHDTFTAVRGSKPTFGGREAKAAKALLDSVGRDLDRAKSIITNAYNDTFWGPKVSILDIVRDPSRFIGVLPMQQKQSGGTTRKVQPNAPVGPTPAVWDGKDEECPPGW